MLRIALLSGLLSVFLSTNLSAQPIAHASDADISLASERYHTYSGIGDGSAEEQSYIVQFEGVPGLIQVQRNNKTYQDPVRVHTTFQADLERVLTARALSSDRVKVEATYSSVFNGMLVSMPADMVSYIKQFPYVKRVMKDGRMKRASMNTTPYQSNFPPSYKTEYTGDGVVIAIIDSGVDYTHPDLRDGYLGGYDYVNNDADPMDDNGHGTHVTGIVAGNGSAFKGTAPDVKYLSYKVLDAAGRGFDSAVLQAIERAANPDGDPFTQDGVDIINLSISSLEIGMADHPVTLAVQNAVEAGIVCIVAAGNRGEEGRASITAPGNATGAITVGAVNDWGQLASFSSQGPSGSITAFSSPFFGLKPDILAPGVQIESTWLGGSYEVRDGTSMASPYIAGIAARMMQQFPETDPMFIKARLMQQTRDLGESIWLQGAGVIDQEMEKPFVVSPACIDLGIVYEGQNNWKRSEILSITNFDTAASVYTTKVREGLPNGIQVSLSTSILTIGGGESAELVLDIMVQPGLIQSQSFPNGHVGYIDVISPIGSVAIPFSIFKTDQANIQFAETAEHIILRSYAEDQVPEFMEAANMRSVFVEPGTYDVIAQFDDGRFTVIKEAVELLPASYHLLSRNEAVHEVFVEAMDINQQPLSPVFYEVSIHGQQADWSLVNHINLAEQSHTSRYFSTVSDAYSITFTVSAFSDEQDYYQIPFVLSNGLDADIVFRNDTALLKRLHYRYSLPAGVDHAYFIPWSTQNLPLQYNDLSQFIHPGFVLTPPFEKNVYTAYGGDGQESKKGIGHSIVQQMQDISQKLNDQQILLRTAPVMAQEDGTLLQLQDQWRPLAENEFGYVALHLGTGDGYWAGELDNSASRIRIRGAQGGGLFLGEWGEAFKGGGDWWLWKDGVLLDQDTLLYSPGVLPGKDAFLVERVVEPGNYTVLVRGEAWLPGQDAIRHAVEMHVKTDLADPDPPRILALFGRIAEDGKEELWVDVTDVCNWCSVDDAREQIAVVQLWVKRAEYGDWVEQQIEQQDTGYVASFRGAYSKQYYALRVRAEDSFGNSMDYYTVDESNVSITDPRSVAAEKKDETPGEPALETVYPNPSIGPIRVKYRLPVTEDVHITVYDMLGRELMQVEESRSAGTHQQLLDLSSFVSGVYFIKVLAGPFVDVQQVVKVH